MSTKVTIVGYGVMGRAIAGALKENDKNIEIFTVDKKKPSKEVLMKNISNSDFLILSMKPQNSKKAINEIKEYLGDKTIILSIMAGVKIDKIAKLSGHKKIIRMMPNIGLSLKEGIAVWKKSGLSKDDAVRAKKFVDKITDNFEVDNEDMIDKVTAVSGSGPAYFFLLAEGLHAAAEKLGLAKDASRKLVEKTFSAAALLAKKDSYTDLIKKVASKKGTTEAALKVFRKEKFDKIVHKAVHAAYKRANKISNE